MAETLCAGASPGWTFDGEATLLCATASLDQPRPGRNSIDADARAGWSSDGEATPLPAEAPLCPWTPEWAKTTLWLGHDRDAASSRRDSPREASANRRRVIICAEAAAIQEEAAAAVAAAAGVWVFGVGFLGRACVGMSR